MIGNKWLEWTVKILRHNSFGVIVVDKIIWTSCRFESFFANKMDIRSSTLAIPDSFRLISPRPGAARAYLSMAISAYDNSDNVILVEFSIKIRIISIIFLVLTIDSSRGRIFPSFRALVAVFRSTIYVNLSALYILHRVFVPTNNNRVIKSRIQNHLSAST